MQQTEEGGWREVGSLGRTSPVLLSLGVSPAALSKSICVARRQAENAVERRSHLFAWNCGAGPPPSSDSVCVACNGEGGLGPTDLVCRGTVLNPLRLGPKTDLLPIFLYLHLPCLLLLSGALPWAVLFKSFTFKSSVMARDSVCTNEHLSVRVLKVTVNLVGRYVWLRRG